MSGTPGLRPESSAAPTVWWVRRDVRLADDPALLAAVDEGEAVLPLVVLDPNLRGPDGDPGHTETALTGS